MQKTLRDYIYYIQYTQPKSKQTVLAYKKDLTDFVSYLENVEVLNFNDVDYNILLTHISELEAHFTKTTVDRKISSIKGFFHYLHQYKIIDQNDSSYLSSKKRKVTLPHVLTQKELALLLSFEKVTPQDYLDHAILNLLFASGIRVTECVDLTFNQIFMQERWLKIIGKGNKERMVPISTQAMHTLNYYLNVIRPQFEITKSNRVFLNTKGKPITRQYIHTMIQKRRLETGLHKKVSAHTLRHTLATTMLNHDVDLRIIQEILGHSDIKTTQIYTHVDNQALKNEYDQYLDVDFSNKKGDKNEI